MSDLLPSCVLIKDITKVYVVSQQRESIRKTHAIRECLYSPSLYSFRLLL